MQFAHKFSVCICLFLVVTVPVFGNQAINLQRGENELGQSVVYLRFESMPGIRYQLRESGDLSTWQNQGDYWVGSGDVGEFEIERTEEAAFFKLKTEVHDSITSALTEIEYQLYVYTPDGYANSSRDYPVIYTTDGHWKFDSYSDIVAGRALDVVLIGIGEGPPDRRATDYTWPGAEEYFQFMITELIPALESLYRVDSDDRMVVGLSYGGLFVGYALLLDDPFNPLFDKYLSFDASFWLNRTVTLQMLDARLAANSEMPVSLFLSSALVGGNNDRWVSWFQNALVSRNFQGLRIFRRSYQVEHADAGEPSFEEALGLLYP